MIKVTDKYFIKQEDNCCVIYEYNGFNEEKQKDVYSAVCYPTDLASAIGKIMMYSFSEATNKREMSLKEALSTLKELKKEYQSILDEVRELYEVK